MKQKFVVAARLPRAGLGNMLLVWARAALFAELNSLPMLAPNWGKFYPGPWLRGERVKRYYGSYFSNSNYKSTLIHSISSILDPKHIHSNPDISTLNLTALKFESPGQHTFLFDRMPPWDDYFQDLKNHQTIVKQKLYADIRSDLLQNILTRPSPQIGVHIRRGDYEQSQVNYDFAVRRNVSTPLKWYVDAINSIREIIGANIPVTVFSDGYSEELSEITALPNVYISPETSALTDLLTMSRSKLLIASAHSSFSAWASYLGQCPTLWTSKRAHLYKPIFTDEIRKYVYEGGFDPNSESIADLLKYNLKKLGLK
jgi:Glycosyl transferase family 11